MPNVNKYITNIQPRGKWKHLSIIERSAYCLTAMQPRFVNLGEYQQYRWC